MKKTLYSVLTICFILIYFSCKKDDEVIEAHPFGMAENGITNTANQMTAEQASLMYEYMKFFPNQTELSIALIDNTDIKFIGLKRDNDIVIDLDNKDKFFEIGSITKVFTATLLSNLVLEEKVQLNNSIQNYFGFEMKEGKNITFEQLANHSSGLPREPEKFSDIFLANYNPENPFANYDVSEMELYFTELIEVTNEPEVATLYSNLGMGVLGYLVSEISNKSYQELLEDKILSKYNMPKTTIIRENVENNMVIPLDKDGNQTNYFDFSNVSVGAGGILSSTNELVNFAKAQLNQENKELQLTQQQTFGKFGLGWYLINNSTVWHDGATGGFTSSMGLDVMNNKGVIVLSNINSNSEIAEEYGTADELANWFLFQ